MDTAATRRPAKRRRGSGQRPAPEPRYLTIGLVTGVHGLRGEIKVAIETQDPHRFGRLERVYVGREDEPPTPLNLQGYRLHQGRALLKLEGYDDRDAAETLRGALIQVPLEEALPLEEGEYYEHQIVGLDVWTTDGERLGKVADILYTGANDVYIVRSPERGQPDLLLPAIKDVVRAIDLEARRITVELLEGLR